MKFHLLIPLVLGLPLPLLSQDTVYLKQQEATFKNDVIICLNNTCDTAGYLQGYIKVVDFYFKDSSCTLLTEQGWAFTIRVFKLTNNRWVNTDAEILAHKEFSKGIEYPNTYHERKIEFVKVVDVGTAIVKVGDVKKSYFFELTETKPESKGYKKVFFEDFDAEQKSIFENVLSEKEKSNSSPKH